MVDTENIDVTKILELVANKYRREILRLLSLDDRYAYELAKSLNITPRAVTNHLKSLEDYDLVYSEKKSSGIGPDREYFSLDKDISIRITFGQNLFATRVTMLEHEEGDMVDANLQLAAPDKSYKLMDILDGALGELPQIRKQIDILEKETNRYLRKYQGLMLHFSSLLKDKGLETDEIEFLLKLIEQGGRATLNKLCELLNKTEVTINPTITRLKDKSLISTVFIFDEDAQSEEIAYEINTPSVKDVIYQ